MIPIGVNIVNTVYPNGEVEKDQTALPNERSISQNVAKRKYTLSKPRYENNIPMILNIHKKVQTS